jgi:predicted RNA-binding Zn ribbon-like protein
MQVDSDSAIQQGEECVMPGFRSEAEWVGGALCLDFANTIDRSAGDEERHDRITSFDELVEWFGRAGLVEDDVLDALRFEAIVRSNHAERAVARARQLRAAIRATFTAITDGRDPGASELELLRSEFVSVLSKTSLVYENGRVNWQVTSDVNALDQLLWLLASSALDLLASAERLPRVKRCPGDDGRCGWLFLDFSRNRSRVWCSMATCGSRAKMRRYYRRKRASEERRS